MTRRNLLIAAAVVAVIAVVFFLLRRDSDEAKKPKRADAPTAAETPDDQPPTPRTGRVNVDQSEFKPKLSGESKRIDTSKSSAHATGIDRKLAQLTAMLKATGKTPCETAYNATLAERKVAKERGKKSIFTFVAPKEAFLKVCNALPDAAKKCMVPLYTTQNREECKALRPADAVISSMLKVRSKKIANKEDFEKDPTLGEKQ